MPAADTQSKTKSAMITLVLGKDAGPHISSSIDSAQNHCKELVIEAIYIPVVTSSHSISDP